MTLLYEDRRFLNHETGAHPESGARIRGLGEKFAEAGLAERVRLVTGTELSRSRLSRVHSLAYADEIWALAKSGGGDADADTVVSPDSYGVAMLAAGSVCDATERILRGEDTQALCLVRPPGHHALVNRAMGFCLFNNVALAAITAVDELEVDRVLIVDWDVHHGNGTQHTFWEDPRVGFLSIHRFPFYPGTGHEDETGGGRGAGTTLNLPVRFGISRADYLDIFGDALDRFAAKIRPEMIFISAGFDSHRADPVAGLSLEIEDFGELTNMVLDAAATYASGRVVSVLEGGYDPVVLAECLKVHLAEMVKRQKP
jgi:acetoin utilization deacetylase AcuC-like enzyme